MTERSHILDQQNAARIEVTKLEFPISFRFRIGTLANDFMAIDASGRTIAYVRQKMFKLKEAIMIYSDESRTELLYQIKADRWIDFNASYAFSDVKDVPVGSVGRRGMKSIWKASYQIFDPGKNLDFNIREENPWAKVSDSLLSEVPLIGLFTGYLFHPRYAVTNAQGTPVARLSKESSFFGRKFIVDQLAEIDPRDGERILLGLMMMILLERRRG